MSENLNPDLAAATQTELIGPDAQWHFIENDQECGPFYVQQMGQLFRAQRITAATLVWTKGMIEWVPLRASSLAASLCSDGPPPLPPSSSSNVAPTPISGAGDRVVATVPLRSASCAWWNLLLPGLAQVILGQTGKGAMLMIVSFILGVLTAGLSALLMCPLTIIDAFEVRKALATRGSVGKWEWFPSPSAGSVSRILLVIAAVTLYGAIPTAAFADAETTQMLKMAGKLAAKYWVYRHKEKAAKDSQESVSTPSGTEQRTPDIQSSFARTVTLPQVPEECTGPLNAYCFAVEGNEPQQYDPAVTVGILGRNDVRLVDHTYPIISVATAISKEDKEPFILILTSEYLALLHNPTTANPYKYLQVIPHDARQASVYVLQ